VSKVQERERGDIGPDVPLRLDIAAEIAFPLGGMTASGLRREAKRGRLQIERIANKDFTTLRHIEEMREKCRAEQKARDYGSNPLGRTGPETSSSKRSGSSATARSSEALAAARAKLSALKDGSAITSTASPPSESATVTPCRSRRGRRSDLYRGRRQQACAAKGNGREAGAHP
jgi:hypothetical protein